MIEHCLLGLLHIAAIIQQIARGHELIEPDSREGLPSMLGYGFIVREDSHCQALGIDAVQHTAQTVEGAHAYGRIAPFGIDLENVRPGGGGFLCFLGSGAQNGPRGEIEIAAHDAVAALGEASRIEDGGASGSEHMELWQSREVISIITCIGTEWVGQTLHTLVCGN